MLKLKRTLVALSLLALSTGLVLADEAGRKAPSFELKDLDGKVHKLEDLKDKVVVLEWTNKGCPFVKLHYKPGHMQELVKKYSAKGVVWLAIDSTHFAKPEEIKKWRAAHKVEHPLLLDQSGKVGRAYGARTTPHMFIVKDGQILYEGAFDDWKQGQGSTVNYVSQALDEVLAGKSISTKKTKSYGCSVKYNKKKKHARPKN